MLKSFMNLLYLKITDHAALLFIRICFMDNEEKRLIEEYKKRDMRLPWDDWKINIYHPRHPIGSMFHEHNHQILVDSLNKLELNLANLKILDIGCGYGAWLRYLVELGAEPENCFGVDLSAHRIDVARHKNPSISWHQQNIANLPYPDASFDFVMQVVVFSSILDAEMRSACAREMYRVTKSGGIIFWIDLVHIKSNTLVGFSKSDVLQYFPSMQLVDQRDVHPGYFRRLNGIHAWLGKIIYQFTGFGSESRLFVLKKPSGG
jgi:SAM-dependent methyltransferase